MDDKKLGTNRKPRLSKGKLIKSTAKKLKRKSQGFSSSFTQKTLSNNTLLAQSLAKEKSRNEKLMTLHREVMASRNEALMRLNETEASFDRLGQLVQKGVSQLQEVATTMGDLFNEIRVSKNNPRDSASMRASWDSTYARISATAGGSRMQAINSKAGYTQPGDYFSQIDSMDYNSEDGPQSPTWPLVASSQPVSPIDEESDTTCSDIDGSSTTGTDDDVRDESLLCRRIPSQAPARDSPARLSSRNISQAPRSVRKVPRAASKPPIHNLGSASPTVYEGDIHNRTSCTIVDMDETDVPKVPITQDKLVEKISVVDNVASLSFNTVTQDIDKTIIPDDLSYENMFCISKNKSPRLTKTNGAKDVTRLNGNHVPSPRLNVSNANKRSSTNKTCFSPQSPDFIGFPDVRSSTPTKAKPLGKRLSSRTSYSPKSPIIPNMVPPSISPDKFYNNKSPSHTDMRWKLSDDVGETASTSVTSLNGNDLSSDFKLSKVTKSFDLSRATRGSSKAKQSPAISKSKTTKQVNSAKQSKPSGHVNGSSKSPKSKLSKSSLTSSISGDKIPRSMKSFDKALPMVTSPEKLPTPTSRISRQADKSSKSITHDESGPKPRPTRSLNAMRYNSLPRNGNELQAENETFINDLPTQLGLMRVSHTKTSNNPGVSHFASGVAGLTNGTSTTPNDLPVVEPPLVSRSAIESDRVLMVQLERLPAMSKSADIPRQKVARPRRNTSNEGNVHNDQLLGRSWKGRKRSLSLHSDQNDTPSRRSKANTPNVVVLVKKFDDSNVSIISVDSEQEHTERRTRRKVAPVNLKEPSLIKKVRRPAKS